LGLMTDGLHRYWFTFEFDLGDDPPPSKPGFITLDGSSRRKHLLGMGVGVTGFDQEDCLRLIQDQLIPEDHMPAVATVDCDVDVASIRDNHPVPSRFGIPSNRGIWYPPLNVR
jgi:hypothetical protein